MFYLERFYSVVMPTSWLSMLLLFTQLMENRKEMLSLFKNYTIVRSLSLSLSLHLPNTRIQKENHELITYYFLGIFLWSERCCCCWFCYYWIQFNLKFLFLKFRMNWFGLTGTRDRTERRSTTEFRSLCTTECQAEFNNCELPPARRRHDKLSMFSRSCNLFLIQLPHWVHLISLSNLNLFCGTCMAILLVYDSLCLVRAYSFAFWF